jgi:hypothetical protein
MSSVWCTLCRALKIALTHLAAECAETSLVVSSASCYMSNTSFFSNTIKQFRNVYLRVTALYSNNAVYA